MNAAIPIPLNIENTVAKSVSLSVNMSLSVNLQENINGTVTMPGGVTVANNVATKGVIRVSSGVKKGTNCPSSVLRFQPGVCRTDSWRVFTE